jgi:hypothetical protein
MVGGGDDRQRRLLGAGLAVVLGASGVLWWLGGRTVAPAALAAVRAERVPPVDVADAVRGAIAAVDQVPGSGTATDVHRDPVAPAAGLVADEPQIAAWVRDLRDDAVPWNAELALGNLIELPRGTVPALERALLSPDVQQRHLAAWALRQRVRGGDEASSHRDPHLHSCQTRSPHQTETAGLPHRRPPTLLPAR